MLALHAYIIISTTPTDTYKFNSNRIWLFILVEQLCLHMYCINLVTVNVICYSILCQVTRFKVSDRFFNGNLLLHYLWFMIGNLLCSFSPYNDILNFSVVTNCNATIKTSLKSVYIPIFFRRNIVLWIFVFYSKVGRMILSMIDSGESWVFNGHTWFIDLFHYPWF